MSLSNPQKVNIVVSAAGGTLVGRTRLQKTSYLMTVAGILDGGFAYEYYHYGPYSEELSQAVKGALLAGVVSEDIEATSWGSTYSIYKSPAAVEEITDIQQQFARIASEVDSVVLELAATALFLKIEENEANPWQETAARKPEKAIEARLAAAQDLYASLAALNTPQKLPTL